MNAIHTDVNNESKEPDFGLKYTDKTTFVSKIILKVRELLTHVKEMLYSLLLLNGLITV